MANPRRFAKVTSAFMVLVLGLVFAMQCDGPAMVVSILVALAVSVLLLRKTGKNIKYTSRRVGDDVRSRNVEQPDCAKAARQGDAGSLLVINAVLGVLATPFAVLAKLLKMQK